MRRRTVLAIVLLIVLGRSSIFLLFPESYFDSDQAVIGLMAKHLAERRAFPLFMYGQNYILAVEAWMAAPLFVLFGASALLLKLPLLLINIAIAALLIVTLERELGLAPVRAAIAAAPFLLPSVALSAAFLEPSGGNLEPWLYVLLLWHLRERPVPAGLILGLGFLHREFTIYGFAALLVVDAVEGGLLGSAVLRRRALTVGSAALIWVGVQLVRPLSSAGGPGTATANLARPSNNLLELVARSCVAPATTLSGLQRLCTLHWPAVLGTARHPLSAFSIESRVAQGFAWTSWLPAAAACLAIAGLLVAARQHRLPRAPFALFLLCTGTFSALGYVLGRCGEVSLYVMRYDLLSPIALVGLWAWFLAAPAPAALRALWAAASAAWLLVIAVPHGRLLAEYAAQPPVPAKRQLIEVLESRGARYGTADYWLAYYISFMTREQMIFASSDVDRIPSYDPIVAAHASEAVHLSRSRCAGGEALIPGVYQCP